MGIRNLWLEGDSLNIINYIQGKQEASWTISKIIEEIKQILCTFTKV